MNFIFREMHTNEHLSSIMQRTQKERSSELIINLQRDSELQKAAVGALLERGDARSWGLVQHVRLVESQLAALTVIEVDRRKLEMDQQLVRNQKNSMNNTSMVMFVINLFWI